MADDRIQRNLPIKVTDSLIYDSTFTAAREMFIKEMSRMDDEMDQLSETLSRAQGSNTTVRSENSDAPQTTSNWRVVKNSSLIDGEGEDRKLKLKFDVSNYNPEEVIVNIVDNKLIILAKYEKKTLNSTVTRQYRREFQLPPGISPENIESSLSKDGVLTVQAPFPIALEYKQQK